MATENLEMNGDADRNGEAEVRKGNTGRRLLEKGGRVGFHFKNKEPLFLWPGLVTGKSSGESLAE